MQYILSSSFVSLVAYVNILILILLSIPVATSYAFKATVGACGVIYNVYVLLYSRRKLDILTASLKPVKAYFMLIKNAMAELHCLLIDLSNIQLLKNASSGLYQHFGFSDLLTYLGALVPKSLASKSVKVKSRDFQTPELNSMPQKIKVSKAQSDPLKKSEKLSIKEKYLPAKSPELFKNKIYLTRRNLTNALSDN